MSDFRVVRQAMHDSPNADNYNTKGDINRLCRVRRVNLLVNLYNNLNKPLKMFRYSSLGSSRLLQ